MRRILYSPLLACNFNLTMDVGKEKQEQQTCARTTHSQTHVDITINHASPYEKCPHILQSSPWSLLLTMLLRTASASHAALVEQPLQSEQPVQSDDERERFLEIFPNAFPITGIKHISDNIVGSILDSLPQQFDCSLSNCFRGTSFTLVKVLVKIMLCCAVCITEQTSYNQGGNICCLCYWRWILCCPLLRGVSASWLHALTRMIHTNHGSNCGLKTG